VIRQCNNQPVDGQFMRKLANGLGVTRSVQKKVKAPIRKNRGFQ